MARTYNFRSGLTTHQPVLFAVAEACDGPIAECGCGDGSTRFLHEVAERRGIRLVSFETHAEWMARFAELASAQHEFRLVDDWRSELKRPEWGERWGLVFVDQEHWVDRIPTIERVAATADYVVVHDSDASTNHGIGRSIRPLNGPHDRGERDYSDVFSSWREFFPPEPWPNQLAGPPTLIGSNRFDVDEIDVDYDRHLPLWWRAGRHTRGLVPQKARMLIGNRMGWRIRPGHGVPPEPPA